MRRLDAVASARLFPGLVSAQSFADSIAVSGMRAWSAISVARSARRGSRVRFARSAYACAESARLPRWPAISAIRNSYRTSPVRSWFGSSGDGSAVVLARPAAAIDFDSATSLASAFCAPVRVVHAAATDAAATMTSRRAAAGTRGRSRLAGVIGDERGTRKSKAASLGIFPYRDNHKIPLARADSAAAPSVGPPRQL